MDGNVVDQKDGKSERAERRFERESAACFAAFAPFYDGISVLLGQFSDFEIFPGNAFGRRPKGIDGALPEDFCVPVMTSQTDGIDFFVVVDGAINGNKFVVRNDAPDDKTVAPDDGRFAAKTYFDPNVGIFERQRPSEPGYHPIVMVGMDRAKMVRLI